MLNMVKTLQQADIKVEPQLIRRLLNAKQALEKETQNRPNKVQPTKKPTKKVNGKRQEADNAFKQGVAALALALPIVAMKDLPSALSFIARYSLPKLVQGYQKDKQTNKKALAGKPNQAPKLNLPKPKLRPRLRPF